jgi:multiple sugar transport system permease protein
MAIIPARLSMQPLARREARWGLLFLSPWIIGFLAFTLLPMIATLAFTFTNVDLTQQDPLRFVGLENYQKLVRDKRAWDSLAVTLRFGLIALPVALILPFSIALMLNSSRLRGSTIFRTLFFMPYVIPLVAGVLAWGGMLNPETGWLNEGLKLIGIANPPYWLNDVRWVYPALVIIGLWGIGSAIIINLAGLAGIPTELYDAAKVDGAGFWGTLRHVTIPMMSPVLFYIMLLEIVFIFQYFLVPLVLNNGSGDPGGATIFFNLYIYKTFFTFQDMSYGATLSWLLFAVILVITVALFVTARRWVYYAGER